MPVDGLDHLLLGPRVASGASGGELGGVAGAVLLLLEDPAFAHAGRRGGDGLLLVHV